ncbi:hypothetical protein [Mucilaginibacter sp.]|uniref:hypothetical protein n=1 Tax=Mucilaginibacter sp. TaxID=1882438 RepID=UPI0026346011|nr:hypothetical protein [Mucilaginibacter sp.]MDB4925525.1 hypothetical protein [Mucilaginibacter sp.]
MQNQLLLTKPWEQFRAELHQYVNKGNALKNQPVNSDEEFTEIESKRLSWDRDGFEWLKNSFNNEINPLVIELNNIAANNFTVHFSSPSLKDQLFQFAGRIQTKVNFLLLKERLFSISDAIISPGLLQLNERAGMTLKQKQRFILEKLFDLYDDNFYPIEDILVGNGIKLNRNSEADELATTLKKSGHLEIRQFLGQKVTAQLTAKGAMLIEESRQPVLENYDDIRFSAAELSKKIDDLKAGLDKLGLATKYYITKCRNLKTYIIN